MLADLRDRLARTRWPRAIPGQGWGYGVDISVVRDLCERWMEFDWRSQEAKLNEQPQFMAEVDGVDLHFWHIRGRGPFADDPLWALCGHTNAERQTTSPNDDVRVLSRRNCETMRSAGGPCGPEAKFWQPKGGFV